MASPSDLGMLGKALQDLRLKSSEPSIDDAQQPQSGPHLSPQHSHQRETSPLTEKEIQELEAEQLSLINLVLTPVKESLDRISDATKENVASRTFRAMILRDELLAVGDFIQRLKEDYGDERMDDLTGKFWEYVAANWPNDPKPQGGVLEYVNTKIAQRMKVKEEAGKAAEDEDEMMNALCGLTLEDGSS